MEKSVYKLLNEQINKELFSAYLYLDIANYYLDKGLDGFGNWFKIQAMEERDHAYKFMDFIQDRGESVEFFAIDAPKRNYDSLIDPLKGALKHEKFVTASINAIYKEAKANDDYATMNFLNWFIEEQVEEEKSAGDLVTKMEIFGEDPRALYMLNTELAQRVYTPPANSET